MVKSLIRGIAKWPTADIAELLLALKDILDARAEHHDKGGGVEAELAKRKQSRRVDRRPAK